MGRASEGRTCPQLPRFRRKVDDRPCHIAQQSRFRRHTHLIGYQAVVMDKGFHRDESREQIKRSTH